jgi:CheY-like chemotaxis protein/HPt (histidine-containing phosphotransfer) domain-containing protein
VVESGPAALAALEEAQATASPFALVLLDAHMPEMDGFAVAEHIRQHPNLAKATIMMLTSGGQAQDAERCREVGIAAYLLKPVTQSDLWDAIAMVLGLPARDAQRAARPTHRVPQEGERFDPARYRRRLHILLAEDNPVNQRLVVRLLEKQGSTVVVVGNGREALAALPQQSFDLVLMDVQMPKMDGLEATAAIRAQEQGRGTHLPIIALTAHAMKGDAERCLAAGMDDYLAKPMTADELSAVIDRVLTGEAARHRSVGVAPVDLTVALGVVEGDLALLGELVEVFLQDAAGRLPELRAAICTGDPKQTERHAHSLKGAAGNLGAKTAFALTSDLETMGREGRLADASSILDHLESELERIAAFFATPGWGARV